MIIRIGNDTIAILSQHNVEDQSGYACIDMRGGMSASANLREAFLSHPLLKTSDDKVVVLVDAPTMMVPLEEFSESDKEIIFDHTFSGHEQDLKMHYVMEKFHAVALFALEKDIKTVINDHFTQALFVPVSAPLWLQAASQAEGARQRLYAFFHDGKTDVACIHRRRFKFANTFSASYAHDALYYILSAFSYLGMKTERDEVVMLGTTPHKPWLTTNILSYVGHASFNDGDAIGLTGSATAYLPIDIRATLHTILS